MASTENERWKRVATPDGSSRQFQSILWLRPDDRGDSCPEPAYFADLNLDQVRESLTAGREDYRLDAIFHAPLLDIASVRYRHEVFRELQRPELRTPIERFAAAMRQVRQHLSLAERLRHPLQKQAWLLDGLALYCAAARALEADLSSARPAAAALHGLSSYLTAHVRSRRFAHMETEAREVHAALAQLRYAVTIDGAKVTVSRHDAAPDFTTEIERTFARFRQGDVSTEVPRIPEVVEVDHVEGQILDRVGRLHETAFSALARFCASHHDELDPTICRFDREVQFYLAYVEMTERLGASGLSFCLPHVSGRSKETLVEETFDIALGVKVAAERGRVVGNDVRLAGTERVLVVSGPNNGGKTTFARAVGQLHHLAALGVLVPGRRARLFLADRVFTHFEREEDVGTLRGKLEDELLRVREILRSATPASVIVLNESFSSTALEDARLIGAAVIEQITELGALAVYVTFVDELASLNEATVSVVSQIAADDPATRTYKVVRQRANGLAYATAIANKYGLSYDRLMKRIAA